MALKLLKHVVGWPATAPAFLLNFSLRQVQQATLREVADDTRVREDLLELQLLLELGEIDEEEYLEREAEIMRRLREVREWRRQLGLPVSGGTLSMQSPGNVERDDLGAGGGEGAEEEPAAPD